MPFSLFKDCSGELLYNDTNIMQIDVQKKLNTKNLVLLLKPRHIIQFYYFSSTFAATSPTFN